MTTLAAPSPSSLATPDPPAADRAPRLRLLTVLRFFAAGWVLLLHLQMSRNLGLPPPFNHIVPNGAYGMTFFFVLSGLVLAYGYSALGSRAGDIPRFYLARFARIYPVYLVVHLLSLPWFGLPISDLAQWGYVQAVCVLGIQAWFPHSFVAPVTGTWSISCEFAFYLLFPLMLPLAQWLAAPGRTFRGCLYVVLLSGFLGLADFAFHSTQTLVYYISPFMRLPEFMLGMVIGSCLHREGRPARPVPLWPAAVAAVGVFVCSLNDIYLFGLWTRANIVIVPAFGAFLYFVSRYELSRPAPVRSRLGGLLQYLGEVSYCFFLAQLPLLFAVRAAEKNGTAPGWISGLNAIEFHLVAFVAVLLLAIALHEVVEKPVRRLLLRHYAPAGA